MICASLKREIGLILGKVLRFLFRSFLRAMGCFFTCFRTKDDRSNRSRPHAISSDSLRSKPTLVIFLFFSSTFCFVPRKYIFLKAGKKRFFSLFLETEFQVIVILFLVGFQDSLGFLLVFFLFETCWLKWLRIDY